LHFLPSLIKRDIFEIEEEEFMKTIRSYALILALFLAVAVLPKSGAAEEHSMPTPKVSKEFDGLTKLVGVWQGKEEGADKAKTLIVEYRLTGGGSALVEQLFKGSPEEMISVYHYAGPQVMMTHYCMLGNQPRLRLTNAEPMSWTFDFVDGSNMKSENDEHMHRLKMTMADNNHLKQKWTSYKDGKPNHVAVFTRARKE
jgi:hypothetical protein